MSGAARVIDEMDEEDDPLDPGVSLPQRPDADLPPGLSGNQQQPQQRQQAEAPIEVIEADEQGRPLQRQQTEQPLTERAAPVDPNTVQPDLDENGQQRPHVTRSERNRRRRAYQQRIEAELHQTREQLEALRTQTAAFEPRLSEIDQARRSDQIADIDRQIEGQNARVALARQQLREALTNQDPVAIDAALEMRDEAVRRADRLAIDKERLSTAAPIRAVDPNQFRAPAAPQAPPPLPAAARARVDQFRAEHSWIDQDPGGMDAQIVLGIDRQVAAEGFDPREDDYWDELADRAARYLPHRFGRQQQPQQRQQPQPRPGVQQVPPQQQLPPQRRGPMVGGGAEQRPAQNNGRQLLLTPDRKQAMIQVGALEPDGRTIANRQKYQRLAERYIAFDRENPQA